MGAYVLTVHCTWILKPRQIPRGAVKRVPNKSEGVPDDVASDRCVPSVNAVNDDLIVFLKGFGLRGGPNLTSPSCSLCLGSVISGWNFKTEHV